MTTTDEPLMAARAWVLHDLTVRGMADAEAVSLLEEAVTNRRWWLSNWEAGAGFVPGLVAQDVADMLFDRVGRWPRCRSCDNDAEHALHIEPELGEDPHWVCDESGIVVAALGALH